MTRCARESCRSHTASVTTARASGWKLAASHGGASVNDITDPKIVDRLTGNAAVNDVPVRIDAVTAELRAEQVASPVAVA